VKASDNGTVRAAIYARVSSKGQVKGFSLDQQIEGLREHAEREGYEVAGEYRDPGYSGTVLERPGLDALRDAVEEGGIRVVLAQDADRITRNPYHRGWLDDEFAKHGTRLVALDDWGDDSHEGQLLKFVKGWQARGEAMKIAERVKRNKRKKARAGQVVGGHNKAYGYDWARNEDGRTVGYEVNETEMHTVRRIFADVARGVGIRTIKEKLDDEHVPTPKPESDAWNRQFIRDMLASDLYRPHTVEEMREAGVNANVLQVLDADSVYGLYRYGEERIPVPIPNAGIPVEVVEAARRKIENNASPSRNAGRPWELSGGVLFCSECGRRMQPHTVKKSPKSAKAYSYYRCQSITGGKADRCAMKKHVRADKIETEVWEMVRRVMDDRHYVLDRMEEHFAEKRQELSRPGADAGSLVERLEQIEKRWTKNKLAYEADVLSLADLKSRRTELDDEREAAERELDRMKNREAELDSLAQTEAETRERIEAGYGGLDDAMPEKRREVYEDLGLRVEVGADAVPHVFGRFPIHKGESGSHHIIVRGTGLSPAPAHAGAVGSEEGSSSPRFTPIAPPRPSVASPTWASSPSSHPPPWTA